MISAEIERAIWSRALAIIPSDTVSVSERSMRRGSVGTRTVAKAASGNASVLGSPRAILLAKRRRDRGIHGLTTSAPTRQPARLTASAESPTNAPAESPGRLGNHGVSTTTPFIGLR